MNIRSLYASIKKATPNLQIVKTDSAILFEEEDSYRIMYAQDLNGEVVHCLGADGYPKLWKDKKQTT